MTGKFKKFNKDFLSPVLLFGSANDLAYSTSLILSLHIDSLPFDLTDSPDVGPLWLIIQRDLTDEWPAERAAGYLPAAPPLGSV